MKSNQKINCNVESCKYQNEKDACCNLDEIEVGCDCGCKDVKKETSTICRSFECDSNKLEN